MFRLRYIFEFADAVTLIEQSLLQRYDFGNRPMRPIVIAAIRGLLEEEFHLLILPDPNIPYVRRDLFDLRAELPMLVSILHRQFPTECKYSPHWVKVEVTPPLDDLHLEFDFRPIDFSAYWDKPIYDADLPPRRAGR